VRPDELPELQHVTDIHWGFWIKNNPNIKNFRGYGVENVVNDHTVLLVTRALRNRRKFALEIWPGVMFEKGSEEYMALIGMYCISYLSTDLQYSREALLTELL
jgi:hypothetical protein